MIRPRLKFETAEDRRKAAEKIRAEAEQVSFNIFQIKWWSWASYWLTLTTFMECSTMPIGSTTL